MMAPPPKRLRILQSLDVDEANEDYINAKKAQARRLKSRMESIFAKYENMHESNSDVIDMKANTVVVDRGHLRRLQRQSARNETPLLDTLGYSATREEDGPCADGDADNTEESDDELAPTQPPKAARAGVGDRLATVQPMPTPMGANGPPRPPQTPHTPGPAATLLQHLHFPQTPAGQLAQSAFYTTLTQTINQAVQQAVAPLFSAVLPNTPELHLSAPPPMHATPSLRADTVAPATDPKWFFPPLPVEAPSAHITQTPPIPDPVSFTNSPTVNRELNETTFPAFYIKRSRPPQLQDRPPIAHQQDASAHAAPRTAPCRTIPRVEIQRRRGRASKYHFSKDDDVHISKKRQLENFSWSEIRNSREEWRTWPLKAFQNRWSSKLKQQNLHLQIASQETTQHSWEDSFALPHHLPTPSSSRHEDLVDASSEAGDIHGAGFITSSIGHYDNDELELLSMTGDDDSELPAMNHDHELQQDDILPSTETPLELIEEAATQQDLLQNLATIEPPSLLERTAIPATKKAKRRRLSHDLQQSIPESAPDPEDSTEHITTHPQSANTQKRPKARRSTSIDLVGDDDELLAPVTPRIKREPSTPPPISFLCSTPAPKPRAGPSSSDSKSTSKASQNMFRKQVKQSWAKAGSPALKSVGKSLAKRESFPVLHKKRAWGGGGDSEDELAM